MHYAASVRVGECPCYFAHYARSFGWREWPLRAESLSECFAFDVAHDEEDEAIHFTYAMDRDDVRMREPGRGPRLLHETFARGGETREMHWQDFDGDVAIELNVAREVNDSHSAASNLALQGILSRKCGLQVEEFERGLRHGISQSTL
jgi:hypothetical protein